MKVSFIVDGPLIWLDEQGEPAGHFDVHHHNIALCRAHYGKAGLGAAYVDRLFRRRTRSVRVTRARPPARRIPLAA